MYKFLCLFIIFIIVSGSMYASENIQQHEQTLKKVILQLNPTLSSKKLKYTYKMYLKDDGAQKQQISQRMLELARSLSTADGSLVELNTVLNSCEYLNTYYSSHIVKSRASESNEFYDKPFIFPGFHRKYYKKHIRPHLQKIDLNTYKPCAMKILVDDKQVFSAALELMKNAKRSIMFNMYLFGGTIGEQVIDIMMKKQAEGVKIYCILAEPKKKDNSESVWDEENEYRTVKDRSDVKPPYYEKATLAYERGLPIVHAETKFLDTSAFVRIDHHKLIIVDGEYAMVGGMNFADTVAKNHDSMAIVCGPFVEEIEKIFVNTWMLGYAKEYKNMNFYNSSRSESLMNRMISDHSYIKAEAVSTLTAPYCNNTKEKVIELCNNAEHTIFIEQLLINENDILKAVAKAAKRGVEVKIIADPAEHLYSFDWHGGPNNKAVGLFQSLKEKHPEINAEVRHYDIEPGQELHMKLMIVDGKYVGLGSTNFTSGAMKSNYETFFIFSGEEFAAAYEKIFAHDWETRTRIPKKLNIFKKLIGIFSDILF